MNQGWIKLHRQLLEHPRLAHPGWLHLWTTLLLLANHSGAGPRMIFQGQEITLQPGQLITSRDRLAERTGMNASKIERLLSLMQTEQQIEQVGGVRSRLITITNWAGWQTGEQVTEQAVAGKHRKVDAEMLAKQGDAVRAPLGEDGPEGCFVESQLQYRNAGREGR